LFFLTLFLFIFLGAIKGSFATAICYRELNNIPWWTLTRGDKNTHSFCPNCGVRLTIRNLIPVISYLLQKGRCQKCSAPIARRYLYIEILSILGALGVFYTYINTGLILYSAILFVCGLAYLIPLLIITVYKPDVKNAAKYSKVRLLLLFLMFFILGIAVQVKF